MISPQMTVSATASLRTHTYITSFVVILHFHTALFCKDPAFLFFVSTNLLTPSTPFLLAMSRWLLKYDYAGNKTCSAQVNIQAFN